MFIDVSTFKIALAPTGTTCRSSGAVSRRRLNSSINMRLRWRRLLTHGGLITHLVLLLVCSTALAQQGWTPSRIGPARKDLNTVYFLDNKRGWVAGDGGFLSRTDDGGQTWVQQAVGTSDAINDIYFRSKEDGFLLAGNAIFISRDSGTRWTEARRFQPAEFNGATAELYSVRFSSKKKGWVVGSVSKDDRVTDSILVYTDDGGNTWQRQRAPSRTELIHIDFVDEKRGWIVGAQGVILHTIDGGQNWMAQRSGTKDTIYHVDFRDERRGWAVGEHGTILRTMDGGETWTAVESPVRATFLSVQFVNEDQGWIVGRSGVILRSDDGGRAWIQQENKTKQNLYGLYFSKKVGWAVGGDGVVLRYER
jgi:photosystem II stability/assembly factor-like uncharacterized protein